MASAAAIVIREIASYLPIKVPNVRENHFIECNRQQTGPSLSLSSLTFLSLYMSIDLACLHLPT